MKISTGAWGWAAISALAVAFGCASAQSEKGEDQVVVFSWYTGGSDAESNTEQAFQALVGVYREKYPDVSLVNGSKTYGTGIGDYFSLIAKVFEDDVGVDCLQGQTSWAPYIYEHGWGGPVNDLWDEMNGDEVFGADMREMCSIETATGSKTMGIPVAMMRDNGFFYSKKILAGAGVDPATLTSWEAMFAAAEKIKAYQQGNGYVFMIPDGVSDPSSTDVNVKYSWSLKDSFYDCILPGTIGVEKYVQLTDPAVASSTLWQQDGVRQALRTFKQYTKMANPDYLTGGDGTWMHLILGSAAFLHVGSWAQGMFARYNALYDKDYGYIPCPGTGSHFIGHFDAFGMAPEPAHPVNARRWMEVAGSKAGQDAMAPLLGSISPRKDSDPNAYDGFGQLLLEDYQKLPYLMRVESRTNRDFLMEMVVPVGKYDASAGTVADEDQALGFLADLCVRSGICSN